MARLVYEGNTLVYYLPACADTDAPTAAEIAAGTNLTPFIAKDGVSVPNTQNMVNSATIQDVFDAQQAGSWGGGPLTLTMFRDDTDESDGWETITYGLTGFLMIARFGSIATGATVEVWPIEAHQPTMMQSATNEMQKFTAAFAVTGTPDLDATTAA